MLLFDAIFRQCLRNATIYKRYETREESLQLVLMCIPLFIYENGWWIQLK